MLSDLLGPPRKGQDLVGVDALHGRGVAGGASRVLDLVATADEQSDQGLVHLLGRVLAVAGGRRAHDRSADEGVSGSAAAVSSAGPQAQSSAVDAAASGSMAISGTTLSWSIPSSPI